VSLSTGFAAVIAAICITVEFAVGSAIGVAVAAVVYRSRFGKRPALRVSIFGGIACVMAAGLAAWADAHAAFQNGQRVDVAPWGEDLWLRNRIAENETLLCAASSAAARAGIESSP